jgi:peptidoglycan/LPS O-acetylase OafA/YrhL
LVVHLKNTLLDPVAINPNLQAADAGIFILADPAQLAVASFLAGAAIFAYRDRLPCNIWLAALSLLVSLALFRSEYYHITALPIAYLTVWIGLLNPRGTWIVTKGDYSYGIYLYSFPIQQVVAHLAMPDVSFLATFALSMPLVLVFAIFSWHMVEKPFQALKTARRNAGSSAATH